MPEGAPRFKNMNKTLENWTKMFKILKEEAKTLECQPVTIKFSLSEEYDFGIVRMRTCAGYTENVKKAFSVESYETLEEMANHILGTMRDLAFDEEVAEQEVEEEQEEERLLYYEEEVEALIADIESMVAEWNEDQSTICFNSIIKSDYEFEITASVDEKQVSSINIDCSDIDSFDYPTAQIEVINFFEGIDKKYNTEKV